MVEERIKMKITTEMTNELGLSKPYPYVIMLQNPKKFKYISQFGDNFLTAYRGYQEDMRGCINKSVDMYYWLEERDLLIVFSKLLYKNGIYSKKYSFISVSERVLFKHNSVFRTHDCFMKYKKILSIFSEFKKNID